MTLNERLDFQRNLTRQLPTKAFRVAYAKAGTLFAAARIDIADAAVDHMAYWASCRSVDEAGYLLALLNCDSVRSRISAMQPKGQGGARHFDNLTWELPIPEYDARDPLHRDLAALAAECERVAAAVPLTEGAYFTTQRKAIREALAAAGLSARLDELVGRLPGL